MAYRVGSELSVFNVAGVSQLTELKSFSLKSDATELDASVLTQMARRSQAGQAQLMLDFVVSSATGVGTLCAQKVTGLNLSAVTVGGTSYLTTFKSINFSLSADHEDTSAAADVWKSNQGVGFALEADVEAFVPTGVSHAWFTYINAAAGGTRPLVLSFTISGTVITVPMQALNVEYGNPGKAVTTIKMKLKGFPACTGAFPTSPSISSSVLTGFLVDPITAVNVEFTSNATNGEIVDVNMVLKSLSFAIERDTITTTNYSLASTGAPANTIS